MYAIFKNGNFQECHGNVEFSDTVFQTAESLTDEQREEFCVFNVVDVHPPLPPNHKYGDACTFELVGGEVVRTYSTEPLTTAERQKIINDLVERIDTQIANIYSRFLRFEAEYVAREAAARAYKAAGYSGDAGVWVTAFATAAGLAHRAATDLIISQADNLKNALASLGALRMRKYEIINAATTSQAQAAFDSISSQATTIAAGL